MNIKTATFIGSYERLDQCPKNPAVEFAFIGRSNVGKSSLINYITDKKNLAKTSGTPGKTKLLNFFHINQNWRLVDLPGYGYAKLSKTEIARIDKMIKDFILHREFLHCIMLLIDCRIPPQKIDLEFANWLGEKSIPFVIVFTKADKIKKSYVEEFKNQLLESWEHLPPVFVTSSENRTGKEAILEFIQKAL